MENSLLAISRVRVSGEYFFVSIDYSHSSFVDYTGPDMNYYLDAEDDYLIAYLDFKPLTQGAFNGTLSVDFADQPTIEYPLSATSIVTENSYSIVMGSPKYSVASVDGVDLGKINYIR